ncbi:MULTISPECIES: hypothetical protein [unclassified Sporosarcina]|uniref:hypothetical protein n=1 Tax=unclassified Sporosarcina TaxID=2647733 RepID=UPI00203C5570|nr:MULTISPECIES: hypothetical protein [unclassified Sporosarcina]GKV65908.1 hypothetical protein NCCP2331_20610 [Sporosarcina sp. NCCP-2331]GLB56092.1 hypothetical protein NCCP2378_18790 [Sporosarcina sp. NCCP-2378]
MTNEQFKNMMDEIMNLLPGLFSEDVQGMIPFLDKESSAEEAEADEEGTEADIGDLEELNLNIEEYYSVQTIDKETLFLLDLSAVTKNLHECG